MHSHSHPYGPRDCHPRPAQFFGGLEGVVGSPSPKTLEAMAEEHTKRSESLDLFVTGNYGVETTSETEWLFVNGPADTSDEEVSTLKRLNRAAWPEESKAKLPDRGKCRKRRPLEELLYGEERKLRDARLLEANQPTTVDEEIIAANMSEPSEPSTFRAFNTHSVFSPQPCSAYR